MNKNNILTIVVVLLFGVSGVVLYYGIFKKPTVTTAPIEANQKSIVNLMPHGEDLNFRVLKERANVQPPVVYKKVNPSQDVGIPTSDIIKNNSVDSGTGTPNQVF